MREIKLFLLIVLLNLGCIFTHDDQIDEVRITGNYFISSFAGYNSLEYKTPQSKTSNVILMNVDSIGWRGSEILAVYDNKYFLVDINTQKITTKYNSYNDLLLSGKDMNINEFKLKRLPKNIK